MRQRSPYPKPFNAEVVQECLQPGALFWQHVGEYPRALLAAGFHQRQQGFHDNARLANVTFGFLTFATLPTLGMG